MSVVLFCIITSFTSHYLSVTLLVTVQLLLLKDTMTSA